MTATHRFPKSPLVIAVGAVIVLMQHSQAHAEGWDCHQDANGNYSCSAASESSSAAAETTDAIPSNNSTSSTAKAYGFSERANAWLNGRSVEEERQASTSELENTAQNIPTDNSGEPASTQAQPVSNNYSATSSAPATQATAASAPQAAPEKAMGDAQGWPKEALPQGVNAQTTDYSYLDWYKNPNGTMDPQTHCDGFYQEPAFTAPDLDQPQNQQQTYVIASKSSTKLGEQTNLDGPVYVRRGSQRISADQASYNQEEGTVHLQGNLRYRQSGVLAVGKSADVDLNTSNATIRDAEFVEHSNHIRGSASSVHYQNGNETELKTAAFTRCEPGNNSWTVNGSTILLNKATGVGQAYNATLRVANVPVFYLPWFSFPIDDRRKSGFLYPSFTVGSTDGLTLATPYYLNLAPNYDATITPHYIEKRGVMGEAEFRYLNDWSNNTIGGSYLPDDKITDTDRWRVNLHHNGNPTDRVTTFINYSRVSDDDYTDDFDDDVSVVNSHYLDEEGSASYRGDTWTARARLKSYQTLDKDIADQYEELPGVTLNGWIPNNVGNLSLTYKASATAYDRNLDNLTGIDRATGERVVLEPGATYNVARSWGFLRGNAHLNQRFYSLQDMPNGMDTSPSFTIPTVSLDTGLVMERDYQFDDESFTQTLEPRVFYTYTPYEDQSELPNFDSGELTFNYSQLWRDSRFTGSDRVGDTNKLSLGLASSLYEDDGSRRATLGVGQSYYFDDRRVRLDSSEPELTTTESPVAGHGEFNINRRLTLLGDAVWSTEYDVFSDSGVTMRYQSDVNHIMNVRLRKIYEDDPEGNSFNKDDYQYQTDFSVIWPISSQFSFLGRWNRDIEAGRTLETMAGIEYENCCWRIRTLQRNWYDGDADNGERHKSGVFLQFILKGLSGFNSSFGDSGSSTSSILDDITGFKEREDTLD
ncbi:LPS-assembly protein LptD [Pokkaliibacter sp. CJK22405]|uniref:LPS-assembly protein LptD n=1 Tax=Pokkaliibacter sp. CJK22405 TaxID=3384615 RepID=UPI003984CFB2